MKKDDLISQFGKSIDLGPCLVGTNLNLLTLRGYAPLDRLAAVSAADEYDQVDNPKGTQRDLQKSHSDRALEYAQAAPSLSPEEQPRLFSEVMLNVRDMAAIEIYDLQDDDQLIDITSFSPEPDAKVVGVRVLIDALTIPKPNKNPEISRIDGNHRLRGADPTIVTDNSDNGSNGDGEGADEDPEESSEVVLPSVAFSMLLDLTPDQERSLFRDVNGRQKNMNVSHLAQIEHDQSDPNATTLTGRALWIANFMAGDGNAFENLVYKGGSKAGLKRHGIKTALSLQTLRSAVLTQLKAMPEISKEFETNTEGLAELVNVYWMAVREVFPEAWTQPRAYILLSTIGLGGFARFGGDLMAEQIKRGTYESADDYKPHLELIRDSVDLSKAEESSPWKGVAGAGGITKVYEALRAAALGEEGRAAIKAASMKHSNEPSLEEKLGD